MFKRRTVRGRSVKSPRRKVRLTLERLEDRCTPHSGVTQFTAGITAGAAPAGIVFGPDGNFWFAEFGTDRIGRITPTGAVTEFLLPAGSGPLNITVGPDRNLWFTENLGDRIGRINPFAGGTDAIQASIAEFAVAGSGSAPNDIASGPDGALWFTQTGSDEIGRITTAGVVTNEFTIPGAGSAPAGITAGPDGALWFTQAGSGQIGRITTDGSFTEFVIPVLANGVSDPEDITAGPGGNLFFTDFGRDQIGRITTDGSITQFNLQTGRGPQGIVASPEGDLYFTEAASGRIGRLPASALAPGKPTSGAPPLEEFDFIPATSTPLGITIDAQGDIWFTLNAADAIATFQAHLVQLTAAATGPTVQVYDIRLQLVRSFTPFPGFAGPLSVAVANVNFNGVPDIIVGAGPGGGPQVTVFEGSDGSVLANFFAFAPSFSGGVFVGADHVLGRSTADIVVGAGSGGGPQVMVIDGTKLGQVQANGQIADSALVTSFFAFTPSFSGGVSVASGDFNGDSRAELIVGAGPGGGPQVIVIDGSRLGQVQANGQIADSALLTSFFALVPSFTGGVFVAVGDVNGGNVRDVIVGAGSGGGPQVIVVDGTQMGQVQADGQIASGAVLTSFFAFTPSFTGGVRVSADDLNLDGLNDLILSAGPGGGPQVIVIDSARLSQVQANGQIADSALITSFFATDPGFTGGVFIAADADHRDGPTFGPPGITITNSRRDINDVFIFQSPANAANTVMTMTVSPFSTATTPAVFADGVLFDYRIANRDVLNTTDDLTFRVTFGPPDAAGVQDVAVRALPAARFPGSGGVLAKGLTGQNLAVRGAGGGGTAMFRAAEQDDPFLFDAAGFNALLNNPTAVQGVVDGEYPRGTSPNGFGPGSTPNFDAPNFFGPAVNTLTMTLEIPSARLTASGSNVIGFWGRAEFNGAQIDRMGRPAINTAIIPPIPRGPAFPIGGTGDLNRQDVRNAFNAGHPRDDRANFTDDAVSVLTAFYPAGRPGGNPDAAQAAVVAGLLLPDILVIDVTSNAGFGGALPMSGGNTFLGSGRKLSDDVVSTELFVLTDDDLPAAFGGGPNPPALVTQNVRDDNGQNLRDGSIDPPFPQGNGAAGTGSQRQAVFPYIGARNPNPTPVPGAPPPQ